MCPCFLFCCFMMTYIYTHIIYPYLLFYAYVGIHQVRILVFGNHLRCPLQCLQEARSNCPHPHLMLSKRGGGNKRERSCAIEIICPKGDTPVHKSRNDSTSIKRSFIVSIRNVIAQFEGNFIGCLNLRKKRGGEEQRKK